jgi:hypothetical protein
MARTPQSPPVGNPLRLHFDGVRLWAGDQVIRHLKRSAPRTSVLLAAFEARGWSAEPVPDPFPRERWEEPEDIYNRLRLVVENLNRDQRPQMVWFHITGNHVWYEPVGRRSPHRSQTPAYMRTK